MMIIDSGTAVTGISDLRPDRRRVLAEHPEQRELSKIAYAGKANPNILIIGPGGGDQEPAGLQAHTSSITANKSIRSSATSSPTGSITFGETCTTSLRRT